MDPLTLAAIVSIFAVVGAFTLWLLKLATDVAVLKAASIHMNPVKIAQDLSWLKGAMHTMATALGAHLEDEPT